MDAERVAWLATLDQRFAALRAAHSGPTDRFMDAAEALADHVADPPASLTRGEWMPLAEAVHAYLVDTTMNIRFAAAAAGHRC